MYTKLFLPRHVMYGIVMRNDPKPDVFVHLQGDTSFSFYRESVSGIEQKASIGPCIDVAPEAKVVERWRLERSEVEAAMDDHHPLVLFRTESWSHNSCPTHVTNKRKVRDRRCCNVCNKHRECE